MKKLLLKALEYYGTKEVVGSKHNSLIVGWAKRLASWVSDDETAWCSTFANQVCFECGIEGTNKLNARSWMKWGEEVKEPEQGDVVVFWRGNPSGWQGHVAFYVSEDQSNIYVIGGNQGNMVNISPYPKSRLLGYRRMK